MFDAGQSEADEDTRDGEITTTYSQTRAPHPSGIENCGVAKKGLGVNDARMRESPDEWRSSEGLSARRGCVGVLWALRKRGTWTVLSAGC
jgi:hypothetical protein